MPVVIVVVNVLVVAAVMMCHKKKKEPSNVHLSLSLHPDSAVCLKKNVTIGEVVSAVNIKYRFPCKLKGLVPVTVSG